MLGVRRLSSGLCGVALLFVAVATPVAAADGFDSDYAGESAFLTLAPGESGVLSVFFANTGTTAWLLGTATQVDLTACLEDKLTCDAQDPQDAALNGGWRSATRYTTHVQSAVSPGQVGTFTYSVRVPVGAAAGTHRLNGTLVVSATGQHLRDQGYYHDVTVTAPPPDTTPPSMTAAEATSSTKVEVTWSEEVSCSIGTAGARAFTFTPDDGDAVRATGVACAGGETVTLTFPAGTFAPDVTGTLRYSPSRVTAADTAVRDAADNEAASGDVEVDPLPAATIVDVYVDRNGLRGIADEDDRIVITFSTTMENPGNTGDAQLFVTDSNGTAAVIACHRRGQRRR